jgi:Domain of Unknown Function (DUF1080)
MRSIWFSTLATLMIATGTFAADAPTQQPNTLSASEHADGWKLLFDGSSLHGWHSYLQKAPAKDWKVQDGAILMEKNRGGDEKDFEDLVTDDEFADFDLKLDWKMSPCADSGVMFHVHESPKYHETYETGAEMQIADLACTKPDSRVLYERSGDLFDLISSDVEWVNEAGQWNQFEIISKKGHLQFFQNGHKVVETQIGDDAWKNLVSHTKFKQWPGFAAYGKGHISLQGNEDKGDAPIRLWFRNIRIKEL